MIDAGPGVAAGILEAARREAIYLWYYGSILCGQIGPYWIAGMLAGSAVSVFAGKRLHSLVAAVQEKLPPFAALVCASLLGIASPLCLYGTIPLAASFSRQGMRDDILAAFMMASVLLNPQLLLYSAALGAGMLVIRFVSCLLCGIAAGLCVRRFCRGKPFFNFAGFDAGASRDTDPHILLRYAKNVLRNLKATGPYFAAGIALTVLWQRYVPSGAAASLFGKNNDFGILTAASLGVPLYACGGGTIPLLLEWLANGMSPGAAAAFMITGAATKFTNLGALKIVLCGRRFVCYLAFVLLFSFAAGWLVNFAA